MWTQYKTIEPVYQTLLIQDLYCTPERGTARAWLLAKMPGFRIYLSIVGPKSEQFKGDFPLTESQTDQVLEAISDLVESFKKKARGKDSSR